MNRREKEEKRRVEEINISSEIREALLEIIDPWLEGPAIDNDRDVLANQITASIVGGMIPHVFVK
jgi:hypothetical protein